MRSAGNHLLVGLFVLSCAAPAFADKEEGGWSYDEGIEFRTSSGNFRIKIENRLQVRFVLKDQDERDTKGSFDIARYKLRIEGDAAEHWKFRLQADLAKGYEKGVDVIKVFATVGPVNYRWLELPALDQPKTRSGDFPTPASPLEELLAATAARAPKTRDVSYAANPSEEWTTAQVELHIRRSRG